MNRQSLSIMSTKSIVIIRTVALVERHANVKGGKEHRETQISSCFPDWLFNKKLKRRGLTS
jgi:hypothetical protein